MRKTQESDDERWSRLDKMVESARARYELARLGMGTIFLVYIVNWGGYGNFLP